MIATKNPVKAANQLPGINKTTETNYNLKPGSPEYPRSLQWVHDFEILCARHSGLGITPDLAGLTLTEAWGLYCYLKGLEGAPL